MDVHVLPIGDLREHDETRDCWCKPTLYRADEDDEMTVIHASADGRELVERHGVQ